MALPSSGCAHTTEKLENACLNESSHAFYSLIQKAWEEKIWRKSSWMTRSPRGRIKPSKSPSKQKIFGENNKKYISDLPLFLCFPPCLSHSCPLAPSSFSSFVSFSSHFSPLCSAHSKDLLKKLSLEVSLLPKYPMCSSTHTTHTQLYMHIYTTNGLSAGPPSS